MKLSIDFMLDWMSPREQSRFLEKLGTMGPERAFTFTQMNYERLKNNQKLRLGGHESRALHRVSVKVGGPVNYKRLLAEGKV